MCVCVCVCVWGGGGGGGGGGPMRAAERCLMGRFSGRAAPVKLARYSYLNCTRFICPGQINEDNTCTT